VRDFTYHAPTSLQEAVALLAQHRGQAKLLAGGTDLMLQLQDGLWQPDHIVDVRNVPELNALAFSEQDGLTVGAATTLRRIETSAIVRAKYPQLATGASEIGSVQIRNLASLGGNIATATPSGDALPALVVLGATARLASVRGERTVPIEAVFTGVRRTVLEPDEVLVDLRLPPPPPRSSGVYLKLCTRPQMDLAIVGVATNVTLNADATIQSVMICLGAVAPTPIRAREAEEILTGHALSDDRLARAGAAAARAARPISDIRASADYRRDQCDVLTRRAVRLAVERAAV
jgi:carbon-monoxide dehydrogenase medium subunit